MGPKQTNKRAPTNGFDRTTIEERLKNFNRYKPEGNWRDVEKKTIVMTVLIQTWEHKKTGKTADVKQICPWGMRDRISKLLSEEKCKM